MNNAAGPSISACGLTTPVGIGFEASTAALHAGIDNFQETRYVDDDGNRIFGAQVELENALLFGTERLEEMLRLCLLDLMKRVDDLDLTKTPIFCGLPELERSGREIFVDDQLLTSLERILDTELDPRSRLIPQGRVAGGVGLFHARNLLQQGEADHAIVVGVDSLLSPATLESFIESDRLLNGDNTDGFIPGEAAGALLVSRKSGTADLQLRGMGFAHDDVTITSEAPMLGDAMFNAFHAALQEANTGWEHIDYRIADVSGEQYFFKEASLALMRSMHVHKDAFEFWHPADSIGEIGAAVIPVSIAMACMAAKKNYAPGRNALIHASSDDGRRVAMVIG